MPLEAEKNSSQFLNAPGAELSHLLRHIPGVHLSSIPGRR
jgi:hypothetical protein